MSGYRDLRIVKFGGSLLDSQGSLLRLEQWVTQQPPKATWLVVGGGAVVDAIRLSANIANYDQAWLHWLCIDAMQISFELVVHQMSSWQAIRNSEQFQHMLTVPLSVNQRALVNARSFYHCDCDHSDLVALPHNWDTTSDSLAALLARLARAQELVVLKSCDIPNQCDYQALADLGVVDRAFPMAIVDIPEVTLVKL